ncbi:MAG: hypothetical protein DRN15_11415 [Thermoprotei archaeon]|nr:MAG: hypothetical protein DRN15_11415 [Thermoprotei archaeon]
MHNSINFIYSIYKRYHVIKFTNHAKEKLRIRKINTEEVEQIIRNPTRIFYDLLTGRYSCWS